MMQGDIWSENLGSLCEVLSSLAGYSFDDGDRDAIEFGLSKTDLSGENKFTYMLVGTRTVELEMWSDPDGGPIIVAVRADADIERLAEGALYVMGEWRVLSFYSHLLPHVYRDLNRPYRRYGL